MRAGLFALLFSRKNLAPGNGEFNTSDGWNAPAGWAIADGVATATATNASLKPLVGTSIVGRTYLVEFDWIQAGGVLSVRIGAGTATTYSTSGRKSVRLTASSTTAGVEFYGGAVSGSVDNVRVRLVS